MPKRRRIRAVKPLEAWVKSCSKGMIVDRLHGHCIPPDWTQASSCKTDEYLNDTKKTQRMEFDERRLDAVFLNLKGWFSEKELDLIIDTIDEGLANIRRWKQEQEQDEFKQRLASSVARAKAEAEDRARASVDKVANEVK